MSKQMAASDFIRELTLAVEVCGDHDLMCFGYQVESLWFSNKDQSFVIKTGSAMPVKIEPLRAPWRGK